MGPTDAAADLGAEEIAERLDAYFDAFLNSAEVAKSESLPHYQCVGPTCPLPASLERSQGFQLRRGASGGMESTGSYVFLETRHLSSHADLKVIPFVVLVAGKGDWLEFSNRGEVFWKAPVTDFTPDALYFAVVPDSMRAEPHGVWGWYLNNTPLSTSVIYVPTLPPPATPAPLKPN